MTQTHHSVLIGVGFALAYVAGIGAMILSAASWPAQVEIPLLQFVAAPLAVVGVIMIAVAKLAPHTED